MRSVASQAIEDKSKSNGLVSKGLAAEMESLDAEIENLRRALHIIDYYNRPEADRRVIDRRSSPRYDDGDRRLPAVERRTRVQAQLVTASERNALRALLRRVVEANRF